jgi:hypothetical protein
MPATRAWNRHPRTCVAVVIPAFNVSRRREANGGLGAATKTGFRKALRLGADVVIKMDGGDQGDVPTSRRSWTPTSGAMLTASSSFLPKLASGCWKTFDLTNG